MQYIDKSAIIKNKELLSEFVRIGKDVFIAKNVSIGDYSYLGIRCIVDKGTVIGKFCSIGANCYLGPGSHPTTWLSTHPFQYNQIHFPRDDEYKSIHRKKLVPESSLVIGSDVYIASGVTILKGVNIGHGAIIGANSTVTKDIPPYAIAVGSPAKVIRYRFEKHIIELLLKIKWWDLPLEVIRSIEFDNIELAIDQLCMIKGIDSTIKTKKREIIQHFLKFFHRA
ncbi:CatB-related O-acetyltransferase [Aeromonas veronii]